MAGAALLAFATLVQSKSGVLSRVWDQGSQLQKSPDESRTELVRTPGKPRARGAAPGVGISNNHYTGGTCGSVLPRFTNIIWRENYPKIVNLTVGRANQTRDCLR